MHFRISTVGCITQSNEVSLKTTKILWTSPSSQDSIVHLQTVVTFDKQSSLITLSIQGTEAKKINETSPIDIQSSHNSVINEKPHGIDLGSMIIIIVLSGLLIVVSIVFVLSFINFAGLKVKSVNSLNTSNKEYIKTVIV